MPTPEAQKVSNDLRRTAGKIEGRGLTGDDLEDAQHFHNLADKNERGTLTVEEAQMLLEIFDDEPNAVIVDSEGKRFVEY